MLVSFFCQSLISHLRPFSISVLLVFSSLGALLTLLGVVFKPLEVVTSNTFSVSSSLFRFLLSR